MKLIRNILVACGLGYASSMLFAAEVSAENMLGASSGQSVVPSLLRLSLALIVVVALIYLSVFLYKRFSARQTAGKNRLMNVLEVLPIGAKGRLVAVRIGCRVLVVGASEDRLTTLAEMSEAELDGSGVQGDSDVEIPFHERLMKLAKK